MSAESEMNFGFYSSYPPLFRHLNNQTQTQTQNVDHHPEPIQNSEQHDHIPVIDLQCLNIQKNMQLEKACKDWGVFRLINHGVPPTLLTQLQNHAKNLFSLSFEAKQLLLTNPISYFWGTPALTPSGAALSRGPQNINWVEGFNAPLGQLKQLQQLSSAEEDPMQQQLASFRLLLEEYGGHLARLGRTIFTAMAMNLNLDQKQYLSESTGLIRVYRYPQCSMANDAWGMDVHTDSSVLSILNQYEVGGLEFLKEDEWLQVQPISNTLIVNLGDMMQAISDDKYKSVKHRVKVNKHKERISICYFVFPGEGCVIQSSKYKPFTYTDFQAQVQQDVKTFGIKVGLERFKITEAS